MSGVRQRPTFNRPSLRLGALLLSTLLSLVILEIGLRVVTPGWLDLRMRELNAGEPFEAGTDQAWPAIREDGAFRQFAPGSTFMLRHEEYEHAATIDDLGGRVTPYRPDNHTLIPFLGDSFTFGLGVEDSETFLTLIAPALHGRGLNLGVPGSGLHDQLNIVEMRHEELGAPGTYVFVLFMGNDLTDIRKRHERAAALRTGLEVDDGQGLLWRANTYVVKHPLLKQLYVIQFLRQQALLWVLRDRTAYREPVFLAMRTDSSYLEDSVVYLRAELARLAAMSRALDFGYVFILLPDVHQLDDARRSGKATSVGLTDVQLDPDRLTLAIHAALDEFESHYTDVTPCLSRAMTEGLFYLHDNHFTRTGHAVAAKCLSQATVLSPLFEK